MCIKVLASQRWDFFETRCINLPGCNAGQSLQQRQSFSSR